MQEKESIMTVRCQLKILSLGITVRHHSASLMVPNSYPRGEIFNQHLTTIKDSYILAPNTIPSYRTDNAALPAYGSINHHPVLRQLFLDQDHLLYPLHNEVSPRVHRTLVQLGHLGRALVVQDTVGTSQHYRHPVNHYTPDERYRKEC